MIWKQVNTCRSRSPVPISLLIHTANSFRCDIYIECGEEQLNAKSYDEVQGNLETRSRTLLFYFNGTDELAAQKRIGQIFQS